MPGTLIDVGGYRVHLFCTGVGSPTVLVASGGFSFDWGLVQPEVAKFTHICTYDPGGTAWSDNPTPQRHSNCADRVKELHALVRNAAVPGPYVVIGFSVGGLVARLYANRYPDEVAGLVLVDHAFVDTGSEVPAKPAPVTAPQGDRAPVLISQTPIELDMEDDVNFRKLPESNQRLHRRALSVSPQRASVEMAATCFSEVNGEARKSYPLYRKPVAVVSTLYSSASYQGLQKELLALSQDSRQYVATNSTHMVIIDQPEIVVQAIGDVVKAVKAGHVKR